METGLLAFQITCHALKSGTKGNVHGSSPGCCEDFLPLTNYWNERKTDINIFKALAPVNILAYCVSACVAAQDKLKPSTTQTKGQSYQSESKWIKEIQSCPCLQILSNTSLLFHVWRFCPNKNQSLITQLNSCSLDLQIQWISSCAHLKSNRHVVLIGWRKGKWTVADCAE